MTFIQKNLKDYTVSQLCSALKFPRSTYYKALVCVPSNRQKEYEIFSRQVKEVFDESKQRYGAVKICRILNDKGIPCSLKRVQRHMAGLRSVVVKKYNHHSNHGTVPDDKENILNRDFEAETINQKLVYGYNLYPCTKGRLDLSGFRHGLMQPQDHRPSMTAELAIEAVKNACLNVKDTKEIILHSDLGSQVRQEVV